MEWLIAISILLPLIQSGIKMAETLFKGKKSGAAKKKAVLSSVMKAFNSAKATGLIPKELATLPPEQVQAMLSMLIDTGVGISNAAGLFTQDAVTKNPVTGKKHGG